MRVKKRITALSVVSEEPLTKPVRRSEKVNWDPFYKAYTKLAKKRSQDAGRS